MINTTIKKTITSPFLLSEPKILLLTDIIDETFKKEGFRPRLSFVVTYDDSNIIKFKSLDTFSSLKNTIRNPVSILAIEVDGLDKSGTKSIRTCITYEKVRKHNISVQVESTEREPAFLLLVRLEDQIEKTLLRGWVDTLLRSKFRMALLTMLGILVTACLVILLGASGLSASHISSSTTNALLQKYSNVTTLEEKVNFVFDYSMERLKTEESKPITRDFKVINLLSLQTFFVLFPIFLIFGILIYLFTKCYPYANFLWGDYEQYHAKLMSTRSRLWDMLINSILLAVVIEFFVIGISGYLKLGQ